MQLAKGVYALYMLLLSGKGCCQASLHSLSFISVKSLTFIVKLQNLLDLRFCLSLPLIGIAFSLLLVNVYYFPHLSLAQTADEGGPYYKGVNMKGLYTSVAETRGVDNSSFPQDYYEESFRLISDAGMNYVRYVFYWEAFVSDPEAFMNELKTVANTADKYKINVLYDNHQFHSSSWLNPQRGTGFPSFLFASDNSTLYPYKSGGSAKYSSAESWWSNWWDRSIKDPQGNDGWTLLAGFLKDVVNLVDKHPSTLGYEILNEPQVHSNDQWEKVGKFNTFMVNELRTVTQKTIAYSQQIPASINDKEISVTSENMAKMAPENKTNIIFKISLYGLPMDNNFQEKRLNVFLKAAELANVPAYVGEWNDVKRVKTVNAEGKTVWTITNEQTNINQTEANSYIQTFDNADVWGWSYWIWNFKPHDTVNFNLINVTSDGRIQPTEYYNILKNAIDSGNTGESYSDLIKP